MFYPNHHIRTYCIYLGSLIYQGNKYDLGVYIHPDTSVSHAIVYGDDPDKYMSGEFIFKGVGIEFHRKFTSFLYLLNESFYKEYLKEPLMFRQPEIFMQR